MRAQIVKVSNDGEEVMEDEFVLDEDRAMDMYEDYILNDPEMDDYVKEEYVAYASGEDDRGREQRIGWLVNNGKISETSLKGRYSLYLYIIEEDDREIDEYYTESKMSVKVNQEKEGYLDIICECPICGETSVVTMPEEDFDIGVELYRNGALIQRAFPKLNADERELIKTGICDKCWKSTMGDDEDEY